MSNNRLWCAMTPFPFPSPVHLAELNSYFHVLWSPDSHWFKGHLLGKVKVTKPGSLSNMFSWWLQQVILSLSHFHGDNFILFSSLPRREKKNKKSCHPLWKKLSRFPFWKGEKNFYCCLCNEGFLRELSFNKKMFFLWNTIHFSRKSLYMHWMAKIFTRRNMVTSY